MDKKEIKRWAAQHKSALTRLNVASFLFRDVDLNVTIQRRFREDGLVV